MKDNTGIHATDIHARLAGEGAFKAWVDVQTRHMDVDTQGHVNNAVIAAYLELGRMTVMNHLTRPGTGTESRNFVLADLHIRFLAEVRITDRICAGANVVRIGTSSFTLGQTLFRNGVCAATALAVMVHLDRETRKAAPLSAGDRQVLEEFLLPA